MEAVGVSIKGMDVNLNQGVREGGKTTLNEMRRR